MLFGKSRLPPGWPSPLHNKCNKSTCNYANQPQPAPGTYTCLGCGKGSYHVSSSMAAEAEAQIRRAHEFQAQTRQKFHTIQATSERRSAERDYERYEREYKTKTRREKWVDRPISPLEHQPAMKRLGLEGPSPVARRPLQSTIAIRHAPALVIPSEQPKSCSKKTSKSTSSYSNSRSTPAPMKPTPPRPLSPKNVLMKLTGKTPERVYNPYNYNPNWAADVDAMLLKSARSRSPDPVPNPIRMHSPPPRQHDKSLCSRNCPIHSTPKVKKPETKLDSVAAPTQTPNRAGQQSQPQTHSHSRPTHGVPVRPSRPPTISLSIHSKASKEEFDMPVVDDAQYYVSKAQLDARGYMPRRV